MMRTVLVGEDDEGVRAAVSELLANAGYEVILAEDGREMKKLIEDGLRPSVILLDLSMPGANGYDFLAWRMICPEALQAPVVIYSGSAFNQVQLRRFGISAVLAKPTDPHELLAVLSRTSASSSPGG
jgi:CheY-like chemotaxis protein